MRDLPETDWRCDNESLSVLEVDQYEIVGLCVKWYVLSLTAEGSGTFKS
jgi:hypothetical protein